MINVRTGNICREKYEAIDRFVFPPLSNDGRVPRASEKPIPCKHRRKFGQNINRLRTRGGHFLTQEQLAEKVGVSLRYLQALEAGQNWPSLPTLSRFPKALQCSWDELLRGC